MTKSDSKSQPSARTRSKTSEKDTKVYRSVAEIRRTYYPKAGRETAKARAHASREILGANRDAAL